MRRWPVSRSSCSPSGSQRRLSTAVLDGAVRAGEVVRFLSTDKRYEVTEVGRLRLKLDPVPPCPEVNVDNNGRR